MPLSRESTSLLSVERGVFELRRGRCICVCAGDGTASLVMAAEGLTPQSLSELIKRAGGELKAGIELVITRRRAIRLGVGGDAVGDGGTVMALRIEGELGPDQLCERLLRFADPMTETLQQEQDAERKDVNVRAVARHGVEAAAVGLVKVARLLPAAVVIKVKDENADDIAGWAARNDLQRVDAGDVFQYERTAARTLMRVSDARVPLEGAENAQVIAYRPNDGGIEHLAIVIGTLDPDSPALVRLHSECFTGDLLGSLRCDCGDQLRGAVASIAKNGGGVLLYLAQEGRGIGLVNKLRAYTLQDGGLDTLDANEELGFDADERVYLPAAYMLKDLGLSKVRLLTNNPDKVTALAAFGIEVVERVAHTFPSNRHNEKYLEAKKAKGGHLF